MKVLLGGAVVVGIVYFVFFMSGMGRPRQNAGGNSYANQPSQNTPAWYRTN